MKKSVCLSQDSNLGSLIYLYGLIQPIRGRNRVKKKIMRFKKSPQLPGAGRTRAWHHHGSHMSTCPGAILPSEIVPGKVDV